MKSSGSISPLSRVVPAGQRLHPDQIEGGEIEDRLEHEREIAVTVRLRDRGAQLGLELGALLHV